MPQATQVAGMCAGRSSWQRAGMSRRRRPREQAAAGGAGLTANDVVERYDLRALPGRLRRRRRRRRRPLRRAGRSGRCQAHGAALLRDGERDRGDLPQAAGLHIAPRGGGACQGRHTSCSAAVGYLLPRRRLARGRPRGGMGRAVCVIAAADLPAGWGAVGAVLLLGARSPRSEVPGRLARREILCGQAHTTSQEHGVLPTANHSEELSRESAGTFQARCQSLNAR